MFESLFVNDQANQQLTQNPLVIIMGIVVAFLFSLLIALVYKKTHKGLSYSQSFVFTLVLLGTLVAVVMMIIGSSVARAFTLFGAFSLIRFRTAIKDTKDIAFVFWALVTGLAVGTGNLLLAALTTALVTVIVFILSKIDFGSLRNYDAVLTLVTDPERGAAGNYKSVFDKYLKSTNLLHAQSRDSGKKMEFSFHVQLARSHDMDQFLQELRGISGMEEVNMISAKGDIEY